LRITSDLKKTQGRASDDILVGMTHGDGRGFDNGNGYGYGRGSGSDGIEDKTGDCFGSKYTDGQLKISSGNESAGFENCNGWGFGLGTGRGFLGHYGNSLGPNYCSGNGDEYGNGEG